MGGGGSSYLPDHLEAHLCVIRESLPPTGCGLAISISSGFTPILVRTPPEKGRHFPKRRFTPAAVIYLRHLPVTSCGAYTSIREVKGTLETSAQANRWAAGGNCRGKQAGGAVCQNSGCRPQPRQQTLLQSRKHEAAWPLPQRLLARAGVRTAALQVGPEDQLEGRAAWAVFPGTANAQGLMPL